MLIKVLTNSHKETVNALLENVTVEIHFACLPYVNPLYTITHAPSQLLWAYGQLVVGRWIRKSLLCKWKQALSCVCNCFMEEM